jgi:hypothetical protein
MSNIATNVSIICFICGFEIIDSEYMHINGFPVHNNCVQRFMYNNERFTYDNGSTDTCQEQSKITSLQSRLKDAEDALREISDRADFQSGDFERASAFIANNYFAKYPEGKE